LQEGEGTHRDGSNIQQTKKEIRKHKPSENVNDGIRKEHHKEGEKKGKVWI